FRSLMLCISPTLISTSFSFLATSITYIYTLSLHDALPIFSLFDFFGREMFHNLDRIVPRWFRRSRRLRLRHGILRGGRRVAQKQDRKSTRLNSSHGSISYAVFCLKKKTKKNIETTMTYENK